jgi:hypothetical protein
VFANSTSSVAACAVWSFSLLSNWTIAVAAESDIPLFVAGLPIQPCTSDVTSTAINAPAWLTENVPTAPPTVGSVAKVTPYSLHAAVTGASANSPGVVTRLAYTRNTACDTWAAVVPAGNCDKSNCSRAVYPPPTSRFEIAPLLAAGTALFTWASATRVACAPQAGAVARHADTAGNTARQARSLSRDRSFSERSTLRPIHKPQLPSQRFLLDDARCHWSCPEPLQCVGEADLEAFPF